MTTGANGASVEIITVNNEPRIKLVRGSLYTEEILTRDEAARLTDSSWASTGKDCNGDCWVCLLEDALDSFR